MKKYASKMFLILLCIGILTGCSFTQVASGDSSGSRSQLQTEAQEMSTEELHEQFQKAFNACGGAQAQASDQQLTAELETLSKAASSLPEDYEELYKSWRAEQVAALEAATELLQQEYEQMISERSLYDGYNSGLCYADYVDFNGDEKSELLLLTLSGGRITSESEVTIELYRDVQGHVQQCAEKKLLLGYGIRRISLFQHEDKIYIGSYYWGGGSGSPEENEYYGFDDGALPLVDSVMYSESWVDEETGKVPFYGSGDGTNEITEEQYQAVIEKYTEIKTILSFCESPSATVDYERGILPEIPADVQRKAAMQLALDNTEDAVWAKLIDLNQDNIEDLLVLAGPDDDMAFSAYLWDGTTVQSVSLRQHVPEYSYPYYYGIYRDKATRNIYVYYQSEVGGCCFDTFESLSDFSEFSYFHSPDGGGVHVMIDGQEFWLDDYSEEAYQSEIDQRFERVEDIVSFNASLSRNVDEVQRQLSER